MTQEKYVVFTSFLNTEPFWNPDEMNYLVYGLEICETTGKEHFQGYVEFKKKKLLPGGAQKALKCLKQHVNKRQAKTGKRAADYCKKGTQPHAEWVSHGIKGPTYGVGADYKEFGVLSAVDKADRTDLSVAKIEIQKKRNWQEVVNDTDLIPVVTKYNKWCRDVFFHRPNEPREALSWYPWQQRFQVALHI